MSKIDVIYSRLEDMNSNIQNFDLLLRRNIRSLPVEQRNETYARDVSNLEGCRESVKKLTSAASSVVDSLSEHRSVLEGSQTGSVMGVPLTDQKTHSIKNWIFGQIPTIHETENEDLDDHGNATVVSASQTDPTVDSFTFSATSKPDTLDTQYARTEFLDETGEGSDSDIEADMIADLQKKGGQKLSQSQYYEAASYLEKALDRAEAKHGPDIDSEARDGTLEMLAKAYFHQGKLNKVEEILSKYSGQYDGKLKTLNMLVPAYCERNQWEQAEKLISKHMGGTKEQGLGWLAAHCVKESQWSVAKNILVKHINFEGRDKILKLVASECLEKGELDVAETFLLEYLDKTHDDVQYLESLHILGGLYLRKGELESAVIYGKKALEGRKSLSEEDISYLSNPYSCL